MSVERHRITDRGGWLQLRRPFLNASEVGAAAGVDPFTTRRELWAEKRGILPPKEQTALMQRGLWLEPAVVRALADVEPDWAVQYPLHTYLCDRETGQGASPDAVADIGDGLVTNLQLKVISRSSFEAHWVDGPPLSYQLQALQEGMLMNAARSKLVALVISPYSAELYHYPVERHSAAEAKVLELAAGFIASVKNNNPPPADYTRDHEVIEAMYPQAMDEASIDLAGDNRLGLLLAKRAKHKQFISLASKKVDEIDAEITDKLGPHEGGYYPGWKITWKNQTRAAYTVPAKTFRVLRVSEWKRIAA